MLKLPIPIKLHAEFFTIFCTGNPIKYQEKGVKTGYPQNPRKCKSDGFFAVFNVPPFLVFFDVFSCFDSKSNKIFYKIYKIKNISILEVFRPKKFKFIFFCNLCRNFLNLIVIELFSFFYYQRNIKYKILK